MSTPLVLLHPLGVDHTFWRDVVRSLASTHGRTDVVAFDLPGHGRGPSLPRGSTIDDLAGLVQHQLEARNLVPAHLVGVSLGGLVAQAVAVRRPQDVVSLVLADTVPVYPEAMRTMWRERAVTSRAGDLASLASAMESLWFTPGYRSDPAGRVHEVRETFLATDPEGYARTCEVLAATDLSARATAITAPTLVVCGTADAPPFVAAAGWLAEHVPAAQLAWLEGAHAVVLERPDEFADLVASFTGRGG